MDNLWCVNEFRISESGNLVIDASPSYGNKKRWEGEMEFQFTSERKDELLKLIEQYHALTKLKELATCEMKEFWSR